MNRFKIVVLLLLVVSFCSGSTTAQEAPPFSINAVSGVLLDYDSGQMLFSQDGDLTRVPASLVKVMTMYMALDQLAQGKVRLDDTVTISEKAWRMGGSQMFLEVGEQVTIEQLLYGISVLSGNDATVAIAEALAGTEELFVRWMNEKAQSLGLNVHFVDAHGLSDKNRITAKDMALLAWNYIKEHPGALEYHKERTYAHQPRSQSQPIQQNNRNGLLWRYEGTDGLKTGFLSAAGYNLVTTAEQGGRRMIAVVLGASSERVREDEAVKLLNYGFRNFDLVNLSDLMELQTAPVYKGAERTVAITPQTENITIPQGTQNQIQVQSRVDTISAPITQGQSVGELVVSYNGQILKTTPLVAEEAVERGGFFRVLIDSIRLLFRQIIRRP